MPSPYGKSQLLALAQRVIGTRWYNHRTGRVCWYSFFYFIQCHGMRDPARMGEREIGSFLMWLATDRNVAAAT